jgi:sphingolipid delta-4 desaturase
MTKAMSQADIDELDSAKIGEFEAERIDNVKSVKKLVKCVGVYSKGYTFPEQGTWHMDRKKAILKAYPQVRELYGQNPATSILLAVVLAAHCYLAYYFSLYSWPVVILGSYTVGAWLSFVLQVIGHEGTHRLVFKNAAGNKLVALLAFLPVFLGPFGTIWMYEHMWHHNVVVDKCIRYGPQNNTLAKKAILTLVFIAVINFALAIAATVLGFMMLITIPLGLLGLRKGLYPTKVRFAPYNRFPQCINGWMAANILSCVIYNVAVVYFFGWKYLVYQMLSACFMNGLHPLGMRQVQEHYFMVKGQPTNSCYTSIHTLCLNIGHHVEHHDFATIPWNRLPMLTKLAPDYYNLKHYTSYTQVLFEFLLNPGIPLETLFEDENANK